MTSTAARIALVQDTLPRITGRIGQATLSFESHLARNAPAMTMLRPRQRDALVAAMFAGLSGACPAETAQSRLAALAHSFRDAGLGPRDYIAIHAALMDMIADHVNAVPGAEAAWADVIGTILASMVAEAHGPRRTVMPLAA